ncbi:hypothetical protein NIES267_63270 [Calothrix parasitica NIES-267]|uniref:Uncharacterized protein n=1 Tax=Calothrix parasitica NIES-267 TaxID=1973488 RepID=A0A1Z4M020_9CYAN|nr:hypothetical protein NIES267_63270 [Calothrix parasitica NIES-267]
MQPSYKGTFEAHITVKAVDSELKAKFCLVCQKLKVKSVFIELPKGVTRSQMMTASYHHGAFKDVLQQINQIAEKIVNADFEVTRIKIEAMVSNQDIPISNIEAQKLPKSNYFEFHVKAILSALENLEALRKYCLQHNAHLSKNAFKKLIDGKQERFITMRVYSLGYKSAQKQFDKLIILLKNKGFKLSQQQREYTVYDSNLNLDTGWID